METLRLEQLEERIAPDGNITAVVAHGNLIITGGSGDDDFRISQPDPLVQDFVIESAATAINHQSAPQTMHGVTGSVIIALKGGADTADFRGLNVAGDIVIAGGAGDDEVLVTGCSVGDDVSVDYGSGGATGSFMGSTVHGYLTIKGGTEDALQFGELTIDGALSVRLGGGESYTHFQSVTMGSCAIAGGAGDETITLLDCHFLGGLSINGGSHELETNIAGTHVDGAFTLKNGAGHSHLEIGSSVMAGEVKVTTGSGQVENWVIWSTLGADAEHGTVSNVTFKSAGGRGMDSDLALDTQIQHSSVGGNLTIRYGAATDKVFLDGLDVGGSLTGVARGSTDFYLFNTSVHGNVTVSTGRGADRVELSGVHLFGALSVNTGGNDDTVVLGSSQYDPGKTSSFDGPVCVKLGGGNDTLAAGLKGAGYRIAYGAAVEFDGGAGSDAIDITGNNNTFAVEPLKARFETVR
jgi:hypothetical protein